MGGKRSAVDGERPGEKEDRRGSDGDGQRLGPPPREGEDAEKSERRQRHGGGRLGHPGNPAACSEENGGETPYAAALVANEGEPNSYNQPDSVDPEGSVSIIEIRNDVTSLTQLDVRTAQFNPSIPQENASSIRVFGPNATLAQDLEPEYIAVSKDSQTAWVTLQENNAVAVLDIRSGTFTKIVGLGFKDHLLTTNKLDASDRDTPGNNDGTINIRNWPVLGMYPGADFEILLQGYTGAGVAADYFSRAATAPQSRSWSLSARRPRKRARPWRPRSNSPTSITRSSSARRCPRPSGPN